jgi:ornithine cyclodeaminase/alanine dehydrogenase-like protein (mu-crystallin family)
MLILSNDDIEKILPVGTCLDVLEEAYRDLGNGMAATVPRYDVFSPTKPNEFYEYKTMSGVLPNRNIAALRLNSSVVKWYEKAGGIRKDKLPVAGGDKYVGLVMLFSTETGEPLAIFPDGYVQKLRVAGASGIAARYLARKDAKVMALLGAGWQASAHLVTLSLVRDLKQVKVFSPTPESRRRFVNDWSGKVSAQLIESAALRRRPMAPIWSSARPIQSRLCSPAKFYNPGCMSPASSRASSTFRPTSVPIR